MHRIRKALRLMAIACDDFRRILRFAKDHSVERDVKLSMLRTQSHILDKGLNIYPFEKGHGRRVYDKCRRILSQIPASGTPDPALEWCRNVIANYERAQISDSWVPERREPPVFGDSERAVFGAIVDSRVSCRDFHAELIPDVIWSNIVIQASLAPSACCRHAERFHIVSSKSLVDALVPCIAGATGFSSPIPHLVCVTADIRAYAVIDRFLPFIDVSLSTGYFLLSAAAYGIGTTVLNWQHATKEQNQEVRRILGLPEYEEVLMFIAAGKPKSLPERPSRPLGQELMQVHR